MVNKLDFLARMSHDIRTPLNGILGIARLNFDDPQCNKRDDMKKIKVSAEFLEVLVNDILDSTKLSSGAMTLNPEWYSYREFMDYINSMAAPQFEQKNIHFLVEYEGLHHLALYVDRLRINKVILNILSNALKYTPQNGTVKMSVANVTTDENLLSADFLFSDTGVGMSEEFQKHMFDIFSRENNALTNVVSGSGLGLNIVKQIVDLMKGTIAVESKLGEGTTFIIHVTLPYKEADSGDSKADAMGITQDERDRLRDKTILLCEDNAINREIVVRLLNKVGVRVEAAEDGQAGLEMFTASEPGYYSAILMDIRMPRLDGLGAARQIRALDRPDACAIPILAMTANAFEEDVQATIQAGMQEHLSKPIDPARLYSALIQFVIYGNEQAI